MSDILDAFSVLDSDSIQRVRKVLKSNNSQLRLALGKMTAQELRTVKSAFAWALRVLENDNDRDR